MLRFFSDATLTDEKGKLLPLILFLETTEITIDAVDFKKLVVYKSIGQILI